MKTSLLKIASICLLLCLVFSCNNDAEPANNAEILGTWHITAIHDSSPSGPTLGPLDGEVISIIFPSNGEFMGTTSVNTFGGRSSTEGRRLFIEELVTTEVADTNFGQTFYDAFSQSLNVETGFSEFEIAVQDEEVLHLEYNGFKFLTLQKQ